MFELELAQGVLLKKALAPLVDMADQATINCSTHELSLIARDVTGSFTAVLRLGSLGFRYFRCHEDASASVDLPLLYQTLIIAGDEDSLTIHGDDGDNVIGFVFKNRRTGEVGYSEMALTEIKNELVDIGELQYKYDVIVGMPSEEFRRIILHLRNFGHTVFVTISDAQVNFSAVNEDIVLKKECGDCIIGGAAADDPVHLMFNLYRMSSLLNASVLSNMVWLAQSDMSPGVLNFPVGALGNFILYFV